MKMLYQNPVVESLVGKKDFHFTAFAQSAVITLCQQAGGITLELVNNQFEVCSSDSPGDPGGTVQFTCAEDGAHQVTLEAINPGSISCGVGESAFIVTLSVNPPFPSVCTVTSLVVNGEDQCINPQFVLTDGV